MKFMFIGIGTRLNHLLEVIKLDLSGSILRAANDNRFCWISCLHCTQFIVYITLVPVHDARCSSVHDLRFMVWTSNCTLASLFELQQNCAASRLWYGWKGIDWTNKVGNIEVHRRNLNFTIPFTVTFSNVTLTMIIFNQWIQKRSPDAKTTRTFVFNEPWKIDKSREVFFH